MSRDTDNDGGWVSPAKELLRKREKPTLSEEGAVGTGSTLLNLACSDNPSLGFVKGGYYYLVGDSASGKTWLTLTCFAEACRNPAFKNHRLIFDDVEGGAMMDVEHYFGAAVKRRLEAPGRDKRGQPIHSSTVESFYYHISDCLRDGRPFIYVLDSQDALTSESSDKKFQKQRKSHQGETAEEVAGSYGDGKAKYHSEHIRMVIAQLRRTGSILIIIGQTRDNLGFGFEKKTRSGGKALRFYAHLEIWTSVEGLIRRKVRDKERTIGANCLAQVKKNRVSGKIGKDRAVTIPIYYGHGIDDVGSCVDYLIEEQHWTLKGDPDDKRKKAYHAPEFEVTASREKLIRYVEENNLEQELRAIAASVWKQVDEECLVKRKRRYE